MLNLPLYTKTYTETATLWKTNYSKNRHSLFALLNNHLVDYPTPLTITYTWGFGSVAGIFLCLQIITGLVLAMHYAPNVTIAFDILEHIMRDVNHGWLLRYLHANGASFFFVVIYLHIGRGIYYFSYVWNPFVWISGMLIFALMMAIAFMGYVLPWGQMSFWGATVITNLFSAIPAIGQEIAFWLWGGFSVDNPTLNRFFALHFVLPFALLAIVVLHLIFLHRKGSSNPLAIFDTTSDKIPFFPYFYWKDLVGLFGFLLIYAFFTFFLPDTLGHPDNYIEGNPMVTPTHIVPEWYFLPFYAILRSIPDKLGGVILMAASIIILFVLAIFNPAVNFYTKKKGMKFTYLAARNNIIYHILIWFFFFNVCLLAWIGSQPVTPVIVILGQANTLIYFLWLIYIPLISILNPKEAFLVIAIISLLKKFFWFTLFYQIYEKQLSQIWNSNHITTATILFTNTNNTMIFDNFYNINYFFIIVTLATLYFTLYHAQKDIRKTYGLELLIFSLLSVIPLCWLIAGVTNWIHFYLLLETSALSTTVLIASRRYNPYSISAGLMYYFTGIIASIFLLIGILFFYIENGNFDFFPKLTVTTTPITIEMINANLIPLPHGDTLKIILALKSEMAGYPITEIRIKLTPDNFWYKIRENWLYQNTENTTNFETYGNLFKNSKMNLWGAFFILMSLLIKIGLAPFHGWTISVNSAAPLHITAYLQTIYKGLLIVLFTLLLWKTKIDTATFFTNTDTIITFFNLIASWLGITGAVTLVVCTVGAITQTGTKQFWAYLSTATVGFIFILLAIAQYNFALMFLIIYILTTIVFFSVVLCATKDEKNPKMLYITDFKNMQKLNPTFVITSVFIFLIFAGLPPTVGFYLKFACYFIILQKYGILLLVGVIFLHLISAFLYLKLLKIMLFDMKKDEQPINFVTLNLFDNIVISTQVITLLYLTIHWDVLYNISAMILSQGFII